MRRFSVEELIYALYHFPMALSSPFISWYFFKLSGGDLFGSGLIISLPYLALIFSTTIFGSLSDRFGSKNIVLVALGAYSLSFLSYYIIGDDVNLFFISYVGFNLIISGFVPAFNRMISFYDEDQRSEEFGKLGAMASFGFLFGSIIATFFIDRIGLEVMFLIASSFAFVTFLLAFNLKNIEIIPDQPIISINPSIDYNPRSGFSFRNIYILFLLVMLTQITNSVFVGFFAIYLEFELFVPVSWVSAANTLATLLGIGGTYIVGRRANKTKRKPLVLLALILYTLLPLSIYYIDNPFIIISLYCIPIYSVFFVLVPIIVSENSRETQRGQKMGLQGSFQNFGLFIGTLFGGILAHYTGIVKFNFLAGAIIGFLTVIFGIIFFKEPLSFKKVVTPSTHGK